jgi:glycosyltransferase involved in cell wall biosynthesis
LLRRTRKIKWIAEFRDPWTDNPWKPAELRSRPADALNSWLEKRCINAADRVITVTDSVGEILAAKLAPVRRSRVAVIRNGIDQLSPVGARTIGKPLRILHVGSVYHKRDPRPFFQALARIRTRGGLTSRDVAVSFVGNGRWYNGNSLEDYVRSLDLAEIVSFGDWVTHAESQELVRSSGLLLLLAQEQPLQVPNKLYEYLGSGVPILAIADKEGETARMLRQVGGHYVVPPDDAPTLDAAIEEALQLRNPAVARASNRAILAEWTTTEQMRKLQRLLSEDSR